MEQRGQIAMQDDDFRYVEQRDVLATGTCLADVFDLVPDSDAPSHSRSAPRGKTRQGTDETRGARTRCPAYEICLCPQ
jgi:hypothetical protein